jgi:transposase
LGFSTQSPLREVATVRAWLADHPGIKIVSRDRGGGYGEAVAKALPDAIQVADRWHLMENASAAFLDAVRKSMRNPHRDRYADNHPRAAHLGRKAAVRELSAAGGYKCGNREARPRWLVDQADCPPPGA